MRKVAILILDFVSICLAFPLIAFIRVSRIEKITEISLLVSKIPFLLGERVRFFYYKYTLSNVGENTRFKYGSYIQYRSVRIGSNVLIGYFCSLGEVDVGNDVILGGYINILSGKNQHSYGDSSKPIRLQSGKRVKLIIGNDVWIGSNAVIMAHIGNRVVIGAGSVVTHDVNSNTLVAGNPAKMVKEVA